MSFEAEARTLAASADPLPAKLPRGERLEIVDALRAIAVSAVVLFHVFPGTVRGGFIGVDVFFVISGFVIALRYLRSLVEGTTSFPTFFLRRIRRLVPAYFMLLVAVTALAAVVMGPKDLINYGSSLAAQTVYLQNVAFWFQGNYFDRPLLKPLLHTWSLAVEEQFYLLFPLLILAMRWRRRVSFALVALASLAFIPIGIWMAHISPVVAFFLLPFRAWEFVAGIMAAILYDKARTRALPQAAADALCLAGIAAILVAIIAFDENAGFPSIQAYLAVAGTMLVCIFQAQVGRGLWRIAATRPVGHLGRISYSWYLWHWPVVSFAFLMLHRTLTPIEGIAALALGYTLGALSYTFVELRAQHSRALRPPRRAVALLAGFVGFAGICGIGLVVTNGLLGRYPPRERLLLAAQMDRPSYRCGVARRLMAYKSETCLLDGVKKPGGVLLLGDSHADRSKAMLSKIAAADGVPLYLTKQDCRLSDYGFDKNCRMKDWQRLTREMRAKRIGTVIAIARWSQGFDPERFRASAERMLATGVQLYVERSTPESSQFDPQTYIASGRGGAWPLVTGYTRAAYERDTAAANRVYAVLSADPRFHIVDTAPVLCPDRCLFATGGKPIYFDTNHLTSAGVAMLAPLYRPIIAGARPAA